MRGGTPEGYYYAAPVFNVPVSGNGIAFTVPSFSPTSLNLQSVGATPPASVTGTMTLTNPSSNPSLVISGFPINTANAQGYAFSKVGGTCVVNGTLAPGASCTVIAQGSGSADCTLGSAVLSVTYVGGFTPSTATLSRIYTNTRTGCP
jgi:hypothetical protein